MLNMWQQLYDPLNNIWLSSAVALIPIIFFFWHWLFSFKRQYRGYGHSHYCIIDCALFLSNAGSNGLCVNHLRFLLRSMANFMDHYRGSFSIQNFGKTGQFEIIRSSILSITEDQRLQMLLVGFAFGTFLEGAAGFGAPVAITAALLVGLGFKPLYAAGLCLIVNTAPVAFGAMGIPIIVAGQVSGVDTMEISQMVGRQLPF